jgi:hypothetical protein
MMLGDVSSEWYVWFAPGVLLGSVVVVRLASRPVAAPVPVGA